METILVVEDSRMMQRALRHLFEADGIQVQIAADGPTGLENFRAQPPKAVVLDLTLPNLPGRELCRIFKKENSSVPIVVVSGSAALEDKLLLLELGADDYVTKPFSPKELLARVRRVMRRGGVESTGEGLQHDVLSFGDVRIDFTSLEAIRAGKRVELTRQEFKILKFFASLPETVIPKEKLLKEVWGYEDYRRTRTVDTHVLRLRQKLETDPANPRFILTMRRAGYKFTPTGRIVPSGE
jgi:DNA-binding response OmpR family regulator